jgi:outer membrane receptor protein involved in Fe transport
MMCLLLGFHLSAQKGNLRGRVIDASTGETLVGVTIFVPGTTIGTTTDLDGNYNLALEPGEYTISVSYISYTTQTFPETEVRKGDITMLDVNLEEMTTELQEVIITAKAVRNTEAALQVMQKKSASMLDGISSRQISRLGDDDAAAALKRVTGVSVQDDKYIYVRGLGDRYTKVTLNAADIPALDPERNAVQVDIFPSNIIENIIVHKTFTPDIPGESTGGHVDIVTKDFPEQFTLSFSASLGYNPNANLNDDFISYEGGSTDWLGLDDGSRDVPGIAKEYLDRYGYINYVPKPPYTDDVLNEISDAFPKKMQVERQRSGINQSYKFSFGNQYNFGNDMALGLNAGLNYSYKYKFYENGVYGIYEEGNQPDPWKVFDQVTYGSITPILSGLVNLNFKFNPNNKVGARYVRNQSGKKVAIERSGFFYYEGQDNIDNNLAYLEREFNSYQLHGKHVFPALNKISVSWLLSYSKMKQNEPDLRFFEYLLPNDTTLRIKTNDAPARFYREMQEDNYHANLDIEIPVTILGDQSKIKFGGSYISKDRNLDEMKFETQSNVAFFPLTDINTYLEDNIITADNPKGYFYVADNKQDRNNSYSGDQEIIAAYAMIDMPLSEKFRLIAGARLETSDMSVANKISDTTDNLYKSGEISEVDPLPSLNLIYSVSEDMNIRLAGSRTIARPTFKEIGTNYYDYKTGIFITGNQDLERALVTNVDLRWEWFFKPGEKVTISGFYKYFTDPIEQKLSVSTQNYEIKYINTENASLYGLEFEFRKKLDFIDFFRNLTLGGNFTYVYSVVKLTEEEREDSGKEDRPMLGQAPWIVNAYLNYINSELGLESNIGFNVTGEKLFLITKGTTPYVYEQPYPSLNFNISKSIGKAKRFTVEASVSNILDSEYKAVHHFEKPVEADYDFLRYKWGRTYKVGLKYNI